MVFSVVEEDDWSNYTHSWETEWTSQAKYKMKRTVAENELKICNSRLLTNKN